MSSRAWTKDQELAISLSGNNVLVSAAAGAGKTSVLVERVISQVLSPERPLDLEKLLVVTFTEKAAAEMKQRVRASLEAAAGEPRDPRIGRQIALLDRAQISTIHAFCLRVLRRYFYKAEIDPAFRVLDANEAEMMRCDAAAELFEDLYGDETSSGAVFRRIVDCYGGKGIDEGLQSIVLGLHEFARTQPSMRDFLEKAKVQAGDESGVWLERLLDEALRDAERALALAKEAELLCLKKGGPQSYLPAVRDDIAVYAETASMLTALRETLAGGAHEDLDALAETVAARISSVTHGRLSPAKDCDPDLKEEAAELRDAAKKAFAAVSRYAFMRPLSEVRRELAAVAPLVAGLCDLAAGLDKRYSAKKRDRGGVDFSDLERYCLDILERDGGALAAQVRSEFDSVFVDEYQDTNPLQERILMLVSRQDGGNGNMFMVGDLKQSIYRFRLAEPSLFLEKFKSYEPCGAAKGPSSRGPAPGLRVDLSHNFRSRTEVLDPVNAVFGDIMRKSVADIDYGEGHALFAGASYPPGEGRFDAEIHLVERVAELPGEPETREAAEPAESRESVAGDSAPSDDIEEYEALEKEALVVAERIREMVGRERPLLLYDAERKASRPCSYRDIAVLMRSTKDRANAVAEVLARCGIPCYADTFGGYFQAREVEVALALLSLIDNPIQDIPLAAVLRSPMVGLDPEDLSAIRICDKKGSFYDAVKAASAGGAAVSSASSDPMVSSGPAGSSAATVGEALREKLRVFLSNLERWRTLARRRSLAEVLWSILAETGYHDYVGGLPGGAQRQANLRALCDRAREFDSFGRHGLIRFLDFIEKLRDSQGDLGTSRALGEQEDVVRLLSIHKAKGLEFPVVFVIDLGKKFNKDDVRQDILFHRDLGVGAAYVDLDARVKYPTALHQSIAAQIGRENLAEETRVLYVALTRAKEKLCVVGSARNLEKKMRRWRRSDPAGAETYLDWICPAALFPAKVSDSGRPGLFKLTIWGTAGGRPIPAPQKRAEALKDVDWDGICGPEPAFPSDPAAYEEVRRRLEWRYPLRAYTTMQAKMSVGELRKLLDAGDEEEWRVLPRPTKRLGMEHGKPYVSSVDRGIAVHALLSRIRLEMTHSRDAVASEAESLLEAGFLRKPGVAPEDISMVAAFFASPAGLAVRECAGRVLRELPFTMKVPAAMFAAGRGSASLGEPASGAGAADSVIVQGVIDVLLDEPDGLTVLDYKTGDGDIPRRVAAYAPQVSLYALAASRILGKPVKKASIVFLDAGREIHVGWKDYLESRGVLA